MQNKKHPPVFISVETISAQNAYNTPFCVTTDHQTKEDNMFTIRYRDAMVMEKIG